MNKQIAEYIIIHKTDHGRLQDTIDNLSAQGFTMVGPAQPVSDSGL